MKKILSFSVSVLAVVSCVLIARATGTISYNPAAIVTANPQQTGSILQTNVLPAVYTNSVTFPFPFSQTPVGVVYNLSTNAANEPLTNTFTTTNLTIVSVATNTTFNWSANIGYPRIQSGILGLGTFIAGAVAYTNTFSPPYFSTPVLQLTGSGSLYATNAGLWATSVTTSNFVVTTGNTNQIIYWGALGTSAAPGANVPTY